MQPLAGVMLIIRQGQVDFQFTIKTYYATRQLFFNSYIFSLPIASKKLSKFVTSRRLSTNPAASNI